MGVDEWTRRLVRWENFRVRSRGNSRPLTEIGHLLIGSRGEARRVGGLASIALAIV